MAVLGAFLAFFPVAVGTLRGLESASATSLELMRSFAAIGGQTMRKLRFPAAVPRMLPALRLAATASVIGVVVAEISTGLRGGSALSRVRRRRPDPQCTRRRAARAAGGSLLWRRVLASVIGVVVAEISTGLRGGIGRLIIEYARQSTSDPAKMYPRCSAPPSSA